MAEHFVVPGSYRDVVNNGIQQLDADLGYLFNQLVEALGYQMACPRDLLELRQRVAALRDNLHPGSASGMDARLPRDLIPVFKTVLQHQRRQIAGQVDGFRRNTQHPELLAELESRLAPFRFLAAQSWFRSADAIRVPQLEDYLSPMYLGSRRPVAEAQEKAYDPRHGVFLSVAQLWNDLTGIRDACERRRAALAVLFMDVDDFKSFNSRYGEPAVDRDLLPTLMRTIEGAFFGHGTVYRYGGDEFVAVVPNAPRSVLSPLLGLLRDRLATASYPGIDKRPTISVGVCEVPPNSQRTEDEIVALASAAKRAAKEGGKNATASYSGDGPKGSTFELWEGSTS